jgi:hypothetical protein
MRSWWWALLCPLPSVVLGAWFFTGLRAMADDPDADGVAAMAGFLLMLIVFGFAGLLTAAAAGGVLMGKLRSRKDGGPREVT